MKPKYLMILEISKKQAYIFDSRKLKDNLECSEQIRYVTSGEYFEKCAPELYSDKNNMVYSGGGHTVLQFDDEQTAKSFAKCVSLKTMQRFPNMELFLKTVKYDDSLTTGENLDRLTQQLEIKKSLRKNSFYLKRFGIERNSYVDSDKSLSPSKIAKECPDGWRLSEETEEICGDDNFVAIVHLDGNAMGARVRSLYDNPKIQQDWDSCVNALQSFSGSIDRDFDRAYRSMINDLCNSEAIKQRYAEGREPVLPVRRLIGAGDDVCFLTAGSLGLECAVRMIENLNKAVNDYDKKNYAACAGVVFVHKKYPFRQAYDLSEALCSNAKKYGASLVDCMNKKGNENIAEGSYSVIDWHIEFGQMKGSLSAIREDYITDDGALLNIRPLIVNGETDSLDNVRTYDFLYALMGDLQANNEQIVRGKIKRLREYLKMGECESNLELRRARIQNILWNGMDKRYKNGIQRAINKEKLERSLFYLDKTESSEGVRRCLYFDAIELIDHFTAWRGNGQTEEGAK